jgi:diguanylate cyclase (GGDEF)-like protein
MLIAQMKIRDIEAHHRMMLVDLKQQDLALLTSHKALIERHVDGIVSDFYRKQMQIDEVAILIGDSGTLKHLHITQRKYVMDLFSGDYGTEYVNNRLLIGIIHKRAGIEPKLYLSAVRTLKESISQCLKQVISDQNLLIATLDALEKILFFDTTLVLDTYIDSLLQEVEEAQRKTEAYAKTLEQKVAHRTRQLEEKAKRDPLTELYNQRAMQEFLIRDLSLSEQRKVKIALVYFDIDKFKLVNDTFGHIKGDEVLKEVGLAVKHSVRQTDIPCRYGGDEFCIILPACSAAEARTICEEVIQRVSAKYPDLSLSFGIAETGPDHYVDGDTLIKKADDRMYCAKKVVGYQICD